MKRWLIRRLVLLAYHPMRLAAFTIILGFDVYDRVRSSITRDRA